MVHRTPTRNNIRQLLAEVKKIDKAITNLPRLHGISAFELNIYKKKLEEDKSRIRAEVEALKPLARLEDISIFKVKKPARKKTVQCYWFTSWRMGSKMCNVYLGSCKRIDAEAAMQKARKLKAEALGLTLAD
jgi:hypothetical protein